MVEKLRRYSGGLPPPLKEVPSVPLLNDRQCVAAYGENGSTI